jgi:hypothetical protein
MPTPRRWSRRDASQAEGGPRLVACSGVREYRATIPAVVRAGDVVLEARAGPLFSRYLTGIWPLLNRYLSVI